MGGFTQVKLKDCSAENVDKQNKILAAYKVAKRYRFYNLKKEQEIEYEYFKKGEGVFPEHLFPKDKIHSLKDFRQFWNPKALGEIFVPPTGTLQFDCYFGRTSKRAMRNMGRYIADNINLFKEFSGSFSTFMERGMTRVERKIVEESGIEY